MPVIRLATQQRWRLRAVAILACAVPSALPAAAQQIIPQVNPGVIGRENQRTIRSLSELRDIPRVSGPLISGGGKQAVAGVQPGGPTFLLHKIVFSKSVLLPSADVEAIAAPYLDKRIDLASLYKIIAAINALYTERGFVNAGAVLPPQHVADGVVTIDLVEGKLGKADVLGNTYIPKDFILDRLPIAAGAVVNVPELSHNIAAFNRINDIQVRASLQPGSQFGQTDIAYTLVEPPRTTLDFTVDNWGVDSTGSWEGAALYRRRSTLTADDLLSVYGIGNTGDLSGSLAYDLPVDTSGTRVGAGYVYTQTHVLFGPYRSLNIKGQAQSGNLHASHPVYADEHWLVSGLLNFNTIASDTNQGRVLQTSDLTNKGGPGVDVAYLGADGLVDVSLQYAYGNTQFRTIDTANDFSILNGNYRAQYLFPQGISATIYGGWQYAPTSVLSADQLFTLGGATSVRGYDANLVAGFDGIYEQFDLRKNLDSLVKGLDVYGLVDAGTVSSPNATRRTLVGVGVGSSYTLAEGAALELDAAWPLEQVVAKQSDFNIYFRLVWHAI